MSAPPDDLRRKAREWLASADDDLRLAEYSMSMPERCPYQLVAFHAQQCAEKSLKAFLVADGIEFPRSHNISLLLELAEQAGSWPASLDAAADLTPYATFARYPGPVVETTRDQALRSLDLARQVREVVGDALREVGIDGS
jgi:HEPN domain-containing protein